MSKQVGEDAPERTKAKPEESRSRLVEYLFPLREGLSVRFILPRDLRMSEVERLKVFMYTLAAGKPEPSREEDKS